ncbi:MAG: fibrobacter succinogenes major paralogous domain-containing protein [Agriterribacter sp.]
MRIKLKQLNLNIPFLKTDNSLHLNDSKSSMLAFDTLHYNQAGQLINVATTMVDFKNTVTEAIASPFSEFPDSLKNEILGMFDDANDAMTLRKKIYFEFTYNDTGQLIQMIMPKFPVTGTYNMEKIDNADTIRLNYDGLGRIASIKEHGTMSIERDNTTIKGHSHKTVNVNYISDTSFRCNAVLTNGTGEPPEKTITDFIFNSKGNLIKATRKKTNSNGTVELISETVYSYYENIRNPEYYTLNKNFAHALSDYPGIYPDMSVNCLKKSVTRNADNIETTTIGNFSFDANRNMVKYTMENDSKQASNQFFKNYIYSKNCNVITDTSTSKKDSVWFTLPGGKDVDGNAYHAIAIGNQIWMTEDLRVTHYRNGDSITEVADVSLWKYLKSSAYNKNNAEGYLYNWYAINDPRNIAPVGWHVATDAEWNTLIKNLGGTSVAGGSLKDVSAWEDNQANTTESGFSALPMGKINSDLGLHELLGKEAYYWMKSLLSANDISALSLNIKSSDNRIRVQKSKKADGLSVRCVKD